MRAMNEENKILLREMYDADILNRVIAERLGCSESCVEKNAKKLGLQKLRTGPKSGALHPNWKGGKYLCGGYWYVYSPKHPNKTKAGYVAEHRLVMERILGRYLTRKEVVHHIDGDPHNNEPENLAVFRTNAEHLKHELTGKRPNWSPEGRERTLEGVRRAAKQRRLKRDDREDTQTTGHQT